MYDDLHVSVRDRILACLDHHDTAGWFAEDLARDVAELRRLTDPVTHGPRTLAVALALATYHWHRYLELPAGKDRPDLDAALLHYAEVQAIDPEKVIEAARQHLAERAALGGEDLDDAARTAISLMRQAQRRGDLATLDKGIVLARRVLGVLAPDETARRRLMQANLANALALRSELTGGVADLDQPVETARAHVAALGPADQDRPRALTNLAAMLGLRYERSGRPEDLDEAITSARQAAAADRADDDEHATIMLNLESLLQHRFTRAGGLPDLNESITLARATANLATIDATARAAHLATLSAGLLHRYDRIGELADLNEAIAVGRQATQQTPADSPSWPGLMSNLSHALGTRYEALERPDDLDEAIRVGHAAVAANPIQQRAVSTAASALSVALQLRFQRSGAAKDLDNAIRATRSALKIVPRGDFPRAGLLVNLSSAYRTRGQARRRLIDIRRAEAVARSAVKASGPEHPEFVNGLSSLGGALWQRFVLTRKARHAEAAMAAWRSSSAIVTASTSRRLTDAVGLADLAASLGRWSEAAEAYAQAMRLLPKLSWHGASRHSRLRLLGQLPGLAADAAACAIAAEQLDLAVEMLEVGRGVLWAQRLDLDTDFSQLKRSSPDLAQRLDAIRRELDQPARQLHIEGAHVPTRSFVDRRVALAREWDDIVETIRQQPGFDHFLDAPTVAEARRSLTGDHVAMVNISRWGCSALLLSSAGTTLVPLPRARHHDVVAHANEYMKALRNGAIGSKQVEDTISATLEWLWDVIAEPVLAAIGRADAAPERRLPRIWWCPTGPLTLLPLHAAGYHRDPTSVRSVLDQAISSYAPTLRALLLARDADATAHNESLLFVGMRHTPGQADLPGVDQEQATLTSLFAGRPQTVLVDEEATRAAVCDSLPASDWAHFSCHGTQNLNEPSTGGLLLHDGTLRITDLDSRRSPGAFIFLSACHTAVGGLDVPDELVTLAAALQFGGWRNVIATLSTVQDQAAAAMTHRVYTRLLAGGTPQLDRVAEALHDAAREQRHSDRERPSRWALFTHAGS